MAKKGRGRPADRAVSERLALELQARRAAARAVSAGVAETLGLERARGAVFAVDGEDASARERPYRRQAGLEWLAAKGRISAAQKAAGERYHEAFTIAEPTGAIGSTLEIQPGMGGAGPSLKQIVNRAEARQGAAAKLALYRRRLSAHPALVGACDLVCGRELTPREAAGGDREGLRLEAVLLVALDLLAEP